MGVSGVIKLPSPETRQFWEIPVLYEDGHLLALDKPCGLATLRDPREPGAPSIAGLLHDGIKRDAAWSRVNARTYLAPAQRLDRDASGILLFAKSKTALATLLSHFGSEQPGRSYAALVHGTPKEVKFRSGAKIAPNSILPGAFCVDPHRGKRSLTAFELVEKFGGCAILKCEALTDRTHQVRVHLRNLGLPLVGDELYGGRPLLLSRLKSAYRLKHNRTERPLLNRPALHADALTFPHPVTGAETRITAPWPKDLAVAVRYLRRYAPASDAGTGEESKSS